MLISKYYKPVQFRCKQGWWEGRTQAVIVEVSRMTILIRIVLKLSLSMAVAIDTI